jgi:RNA polymerase sigma-70 factor (ECF subfamily)
MDSDLSEIQQQLERAVSGDQRAMSDVWGRYQERLKRLIRLRMDRRVQGRVDASDVLQEVFIDFATRLEDYLNEPTMPFYLWLRFLTSQRLQLVHRYHLGTRKRDAGRELSLIKNQMPEASSVSLAAQLIGRFTSVIEAVQRAEMQLILQNTINDLDPIDREVLALRHFEELSNQEAALVLGIDPSAASTRHVRALKRLRQSLETRPGFFEKPESET